MSENRIDILKHILLQEFERMQPDISTFEDDPMQFILRKYPGLNETLTYLMTPSFQDYLTGVYIMAPKPTTFKIVLHNGQFFFLQFTGKTYQATVAGKNYYLMSIGEKERCMLAIARLLRFGSPLKTKGPEGAEQGTRDEEGSGSETTGGETGGGEAAPEAGAEEETIAEAKILEEVLKNSLSEKQKIVDPEKKEISDQIGTSETLKKSELFDKLSKQTYEFYGNEMGDLKTVFPKDGINVIENWINYTNKKVKYSNTGKKVEACIINYANKKGVQSSDISSGRGEDVKIGEKIVEIKSSKTSSINTKLQTSFYSSNKFYAFVTNTDSKNIEVRIIFGKLLRELSLGKDLLNGEDINVEKLETQIEDGLKKIDFKTSIKNSLIGNTTQKVEDSFKIGNKLKIRFLVYIEPQYGKNKNTKEKPTS